MGFDLLFQNAVIYDGSGKPPFVGDVAIQDGKIAAAGKLDGAVARRTIRAAGKALCPGFIDVHNHLDLVIFKDDHERILEPLLRQGITTIVGGNCGWGAAPFSKAHRQAALDYLSAIGGEDPKPLISWNTVAEFLETLEKRGVLVNMGFLAPHGMLRIAAKGLENVPASKDDVRQMKVHLNDALDAGVLGMSTGLMYPPGLASDEEELVELARELSKKNAVFTSHLRSYTNTLSLAIEEVLNVSRRTGARVQVSHFFFLPHVNETIDSIVYGLLRVGARIYKHLKIPVPLGLTAKNQFKRIDKAIQSGLPVGADAMPTSTGFTHALAFFPPWATQGTLEDILGRISSPQIRREIHKTIREGRSVWPHRDAGTWPMNFFKIMGYKSIYLMSVVSEANKRYEGLNIHDIAKARGQDPFDAICDIILEERGRVLVFEVPTYPGDEFLERAGFDVISNPNVSIVTDNMLLGFGKPHHLFYDCYPRLLANYVRRQKLLSLEEAIRKSTSLPAAQLGIAKRGLIRKGYWADLVLFDPERIESLSTPDRPDRFPKGIEYVLVNGNEIVTPEGYFPSRKGHIIRRAV